MTCVIEEESADHVWVRAAEAFRVGEGVVKQPSRAGLTLELLHAILVIRKPQERWILSRQPAINPAFAIAEVVWILAGRNDAAFVNHWNPVLPRYAGRDANYYGAYGHRLRSNFGVDQLEHAFRTLECNPDSRQVVLQIWDSSRDLPGPDGTPRSEDVPCNVCSMLKVRGNRLEWTQVLRSNDLFLGVPHNVVQFTTLQEVIAGWLNLDLGTYTHLSDSLHLYERDLDHVRSGSLDTVPCTSDSLALPKRESDYVWGELERRMASLAMDPALSPAHWRTLVATSDLPEAFGNLLRVVAADDARRRGRAEASSEVIAGCSNPLLLLAWQRWASRREKPSREHRPGDGT